MPKNNEITVKTEKTKKAELGGQVQEQPICKHCRRKNEISNAKYCTHCGSKF